MFSLKPCFAGPCPAGPGHHWRLASGTFSAVSSLGGLEEVQTPNEAYHRWKKKPLPAVPNFRDVNWIFPLCLGHLYSGLSISNWLMLGGLGFPQHQEDGRPKCPGHRSVNAWIAKRKPAVRHATGRTEQRRVSDTP